MAGKSTADDSRANAAADQRPESTLRGDIDRLFLAIALAGGVVDEAQIAERLDLLVEPRDATSSDSTLTGAPLDLRHRLLQAGLVDQEVVTRFEELLSELLRGGDHPQSILKLRLDRVLGDLTFRIRDKTVWSFLLGREESTLPLRTGEVAYRLLEPVGRGGQGEVWRSLDEKLGRVVAVKRLVDSQQAGPERRRRFLREAHVTGRLEHPSIVPIYSLDAGGPDRPPCYAMRLLHGRLLSQVIKDFRSGGKRLIADRKGLASYLEIFIKICDGIRFSHDQGVLHRDLKPTNIMVGEFGEVSIIDWGLAKPIGAGASEESLFSGTLEPGDRLHTQAGQVIGSPLYLAPEQAGGTSDAQDERTDVFGLGAVLFEMLSGHAPREYLRGKSMSVVLACAATETIPRADAEVEGVPAPLASICAHALNVDPADRYQSVEELTHEVRRWLSDAPVTVHPETPIERVSRWMYHHRHVAVWGSALVAVVTLTFILLLGYAMASYDSVVADRLDSFQENFDDLSRTIHQNAEVVADRTLVMAELPRIDEFVAGKGPADKELELLPATTKILRPMEWTCRAYAVRMATPHVSDWVITPIAVPVDRHFAQIEPLLGAPTTDRVIDAARGALTLKPKQVYASHLYPGPTPNKGQSVAGSVYTSAPIYSGQKLVGCVVLQSLFGVEPTSSIEVEPPEDGRDIFLANPNGDLLVSQFVIPGVPADKWPRATQLAQLFPETADLLEPSRDDGPVFSPRTRYWDKILFAESVSITSWTPQRRLILALARSYDACIEPARDRLLKTTGLILAVVAAGSAAATCLVLGMRFRPKKRKRRTPSPSQ